MNYDSEDRLFDEDAAIRMTTDSFEDRTRHTLRQCLLIRADNRIHIRFMLPVCESEENERDGEGYMGNLRIRPC